MKKFTPPSCLNDCANLCSVGLTSLFKGSSQNTYQSNYKTNDHEEPINVTPKKSETKVAKKITKKKKVAKKKVAKKKSTKK